MGKIVFGAVVGEEMSTELDVGQCKQSVGDRGGWHWHTCRRKAVKDGYCKQHHPDRRLARQKANDEKYDKQRRVRALEIRAPFFHMTLQTIADGAENPREIAIAALEAVDG